LLNRLLKACKGIRFVLLFALAVVPAKAAGQVAIDADQSDIYVHTLRGHRRYVLSVAFSPDGSLIASGSGDHTVKLWDVELRREIATLKGHQSRVMSVAFSPDGAILASGSWDNTIKLWDVERHREITILKGHENNVGSVAFSPDGAILASASFDNTIKLWDVAKRTEIATLGGHQSRVMSVAFSPDGSILAGGRRILFVPGGRYDKTITLWDVAKRTEIAILKGHENNVGSVAFSPDGAILASGSWDNTIKLWDVERHRDIATLRGHQYRVMSVAFSPDGTILASGSYDSTVRLWDVVENKEIATLKGRQGMVRSVAFSPDGSLLASGSSDNTIKLWDVAEISGVSSVFAALTPSFPPVLEGRVEFREPSGNDILDAGESGSLVIILSNSGQGAAYNLKIVVTPDTSYRHVEFEIPQQGIRKLGADDSVRISIPVTADDEVGTQEVAFTIQVTEANGFDLDPPLRISFQTQELLPPQLVVTDYAIEDFNHNRRIERSEIVKVIARVQNKGVGTASAVGAKVKVGQNVFITPDSRSTFDLGQLEPGEYADIEFSIFSNNKATSLPVTIELSELHGKFEATKTLDLPFDAVQKQPTEMVVEGTLAVIPQVESAPDLVADVDRNIPKGAVLKPDAVAVIIGNSAYEDSGIPPVEFAINDASVVREYVTRVLGFSSENIMFFTDATLRDFSNIFGREGRPKGRLYDYVKSGLSEVFVYYSGHGAPDPDSKQAYFLPSDCIRDDILQTAYSRNTLFENLSQIPARSITVVLDACFSGGSDAGSLLGDMSPLVIDIEPSMTLPRGVVFSSSTQDQVSSWYREKNHGLFTYYFLKGLRGDADLDSDKKVTIGELETFLTDPADGVPYWARRLKSREQTPVVVARDKDQAVVELK